MKTLKRLTLLFIFFILIAGTVGYFYGLRPNTIDTFWANITSHFSVNKDTLSLVNDATPKEKTVSYSAPVKKVKSNPKPAKEHFEFQPLPVNPFGNIDKHAIKCPKSEEQTIEALAAYLQQNTNSDLEKARAIYIWLTKNIRYDDEGFNTNKNSDYSAEGVLKSRKAVCEGFSNLFYALGKHMNLPIEKVIGYSKGYGYTTGQTFSDTDHAWNIIKINGQWRVFDATWGEGSGKSVKGKLVSKKDFDNYWFNVSPYEAIFTHLPQNKAFLNVQPAIDLKIFENLPYIEPAYFEIGFDGTTTYRNVCNNKSLQFPMCYSLPTHVKIIAAPKYNSLELNKSYIFELYVPRGINVAAIDAKNNWTDFTMNKGTFKLTYTPSEPGELSISIKYEKGGKSHHTVLQYNVATTKASV